MSYYRDVVKFPDLYIITCVSLKISLLVVTPQKSCCYQSTISLARALNQNPAVTRA